MNGSVVRVIFNTLLLVVAQVMILNRIHLFGCATPLLLVYIIICLPLNAPRWASLLLAFSLGLVADMFANTPGVAAMALTAVAFVQPTLMRMMLPRDIDHVFTPTMKTLGRAKYLVFSGMLTFLYCALFFLLENFGFSHIGRLSLSVGASTVLTYIFILTFESIRKH